MENIFRLKDGITTIRVNNKNITHFTIPNGVTTIGYEAFCGCSALQSVDIPNSVTTIDSGAFSACLSLHYIDIPDSVTTIKNEAFAYCLALRSISIHIVDIENANIDERAFEGVNTDNCVLYIPPGTRWAYRHHPVFGKFKNIEIDKQD